MADSVQSEVFNQTIQGKRHLLIKDYYSAVQSFEKVCQLLDELYGKGADECGDAYLNYGVSLLELARQETGASEGLVNANINDPSASEDSEDDNEEGEEEGEGEGEESGGNEDASPDDQKENFEEDLGTEDIPLNGNADDKESKSDTNKNDNANGISTEQSSQQPASFDPNEPSTSTGITANKEEDDDPTTIEISWEVLSMAQEIFERLLSNGKDVRYKLAETLQKMGEIAIEWENNALAIQLLNSCLDLRKDLLPDDDRLIAETYYHIGNAHSFISQVDQANNSFQMAINVIQRRIDNKQNILSDEKFDPELEQSIRDEIRDLEDLLPDMVARIEDKRDQMSTVEQALRMEAEENKEAQMATKKICEPKPVNNVSHLVKRKRPDQGNQDGVKKLCTPSDPTKLETPHVPTTNIGVTNNESKM